ncbi:beta-ketoacyl-ACP synthase III [Neorhodopirellula pilleata]|uniref:Beta-ketoacyl-[acyl-carrier-protein] synthase III n=1 Tax=Neorhodopirellula pilleata TaxID=2714738 RepID=A0A5C6A605_9BACT|nr:beta-ketoacyl-ACP synthase III [Neorhodopirellula pilleata]TWT94939.1 3-oxoacyl-[acyl-carrier-protein] synthase 3 [Neorhodopirellula pilleata]
MPVEPDAVVTDTPVVPSAGETPSDDPSMITQSPVTRHGRLGKVSGVRIAGTGSYVPDRVVSNEDMAALGCDSEWIVRRTGIRARRHADHNQATSDMCFHAATRCLENAQSINPKFSAADVDLVIVATITPDYPTPSTASILQSRLKLSAPAMDMGVACSGFTYALVTASQFVAMGNAKNVLVVGSDLMSRTIDPDDKKIYPLFGDAAGAVILTSTGSGEAASSDNHDAAPADGLLAYQLGSEGAGAGLLCIPAGGSRQLLTPEAHAAKQHYMAMDGRNVFKWAVRVVDESIQDVLRAAGVTAQDLDLLILHQANQRIIDSAVSDLNVDPAKVFVNLDQYGNTSAASIPLALDEAARAGRLKRGDLVLMSGFGAGLAWGTVLLRW